MVFHEKGPAMTTPIAIISPVPTPYRIHFHKRIAAELPVKLHSLFTHSDAVSGPAQWRMTLPPEIGAVGFDGDMLTSNTRDWARQWRLFRRITAFLVANDIRLIILDGYADLTRMLLLRWAKKRGVPLFLRGDSNIHDDRGLPFPKKCAKKAVVGWAIRQAAGIMPMGSCGQAYFDAYGGKGKPSFLCPYEPDYGTVFAAPAADRRKRFLYCGRLVPQKRVDIALDAFASIAQACPDWDLLIAGDGPLRGGLEARVPAPLRGRIQFLGFLQTAETVRAYQSSDCLLLPSEREPWAVVINEACAAGLAIVCTDVVGAAAELVEDGVNGFKVRPGDAGAFAAAMGKVAGNHAAMKHSSQAVLEKWRSKADPVNAVRQALTTLRMP
jgi:glycosyltransferase involved in cell wall biosynthesis